MTSKVGVDGVENEIEIQNLSCPPSTMAKSYRNMAAYGNHFRIMSWLGANSMVTYDCGVLGQFEHTQPITWDNPKPIMESMTYIGECQEIIELDYGMTKVPILLCSWVQTTGRGANVSMCKR